jgi:hypothetical protein
MDPLDPAETDDTATTRLAGRARLARPAVVSLPSRLPPRQPPLVPLAPEVYWAEVQRLREELTALRPPQPPTRHPTGHRTRDRT